MMDFVNYPLNDRWWLEDQFDQIAKMTDRSAQLKQIDVLRNWENPGEGGYYDVLGDVGRSPAHDQGVQRGRRHAHLSRVAHADATLDGREAARRAASPGTSISTGFRAA